MQDQQEIRERKYQHYLEKRKEVEDHKNQLNNIRDQYRANIQNRQVETQERNKLIRMKQQLGLQKRQEYLAQRREMAITDKKKNKVQHTWEIQQMEAEAERLEKKEADLLKMLTVTQERENLVFEELKHALIESSLSHKIRPEKIKLDRIEPRKGARSKLSTGGDPIL